ncbi:quinone oxidoreductase family protein [Sphingobium bisphenolivorans]|uniref:quinone oxidoreductase family protein n=1 Tax=Sphingobium bisphenolivorans TaxID=1335760 RepID=UPI0003A6BB31|nr:quinone oxidoreductase [Sphingobium bisphenolivorans]
MVVDAWRMVARTHGGPEVIAREPFEPGEPAHSEVLIAQEAVGLNYVDTYYRSGLYPAPLPIPLGSEGAGTVIGVGSAVSNIKVGDRVGCVAGLGAYATHRVVPADRVVKLSAAVSTEDAAAMMLKGMTACYLAEDCLRLEAGQTALVHAAAGGVGSVLVPWLRDKGVIVIAHSGSAEKAARVDADHSLHGSLEALAAQVREITSGQGVEVVYDGVGKDSWTASLASLKRRGLMVSYGNASGAVPPVSLLDLSRGSLFVTRPTLADYTATADDLARCAARLFDRMERGVVKAVIGQRFALSDAAEAHRALEARRTVGTTLLIP